MSKEKYQGSRSDTVSYERRIILVGKTGVGKSAAGNTILGREAFESVMSPSSMTSECQKAKGNVGGRRIAVIDTPGLFDTHFSEDEVLKRIKMCISLSSPGPHVFLVVLHLGRFTQEEKDTVKMIQTTFGEDAAKYTMVLFTHGDQLKKMNKSIEGYISESAALQDIIRSCYGRYHVFNNEIKDAVQTNHLLDKIDKMTMANKRSYYTNDMFMKAEEAIEKEKQRLLQEMEDQKLKELEELRAKYVSRSVYRREEELLNIRYEHEARDRGVKSYGFKNGLLVALTTTFGAMVGGVTTGKQGGLLLGAAAGAFIGVTVVDQSELSVLPPPRGQLFLTGSDALGPFHKAGSTNSLTLSNPELIYSETGNSESSVPGQLI